MVVMIIEEIIYFIHVENIHFHTFFLIEFFPLQFVLLVIVFPSKLYLLAFQIYFTMISFQKNKDYFDHPSIF